MFTRKRKKFISLLLVILLLFSQVFLSGPVMAITNNEVEDLVDYSEDSSVQEETIADDTLSDEIQNEEADPPSNKTKKEEEVTNTHSDETKEEVENTTPSEETKEEVVDTLRFIETREEVEEDSRTEGAGEEAEETLSFSAFNVTDNGWLFSDLGDLDLSDNKTKGQILAESLIGSGVVINNINFTGVDHSAGFFQTDEETIGFESGVILSTGSIHDVAGPNVSTSTSTNNRLPGDEDLSALIPGYETYDATILEFDFIPTSDELYFEYVFASEEYNQFVNSTFNDVFGFFVNGENVATIPGTDTPVSINNVNGGNPFGTNASHPEYFRNNYVPDGGGDINTEMDGLTVVLPIQANVVPGEYNRIKLAIADAGDYIYDSNVFIRSGSFVGQASVISGLGAKDNIKSQHPNHPEMTIGEPVVDPIDSATGAQVLKETLLSIDGAIPLEFDLFYNSLLLDEGQMGYGWTNNYEMSLSESEDGLIYIHWDSNRVNTFAETSDDTYSSPDHAMKHYTLEKNDQGEYTLTSKHHEQYFFNAEGMLVKKENEHGQAITFHYNEANILTHVEEPISGQTITFHYNNDGLLTSISDKLDREVMFKYDNDHYLTTLIDVEGYSTHYTYNEAGQLLTAKDTDGNTIFTNVHDSSGRVIEQTDAKKNTGRFAYEEDQEAGILVTTYTDREGNDIEFTYNNRYQLINRTDELGHSIEMEYDSDGNLIKETDENGNATTYAYDDRGNVTSVTNALGNSTTFNYDNKNNLLSISQSGETLVSFSYTEQNQIKEVKDAFGETTTFSYNNQGLVISETLRNGGVNQYKYENGLVQEAINADGHSTLLNYDIVGRLKTVTDEDGYKTSFDYDKRDNVVKITNPLGDHVSYEYDQFSNLVKQTDENGNVTTYAYDSNNNVIRETNALNHTIQYGYDKEDRLTSITDAKGNTTTFTLDDKGRITGIKNPLGNTSQLAYDAVGHMTAEINADGTTIASYEYDEVGNVIKITDALEQMEKLEYDSNNNVTKIINKLGNETTFTYDALGRIVRSVDAREGVSKTTYDADGNRNALVDANENKLQFDFNSTGELTSITSAAGYEITYDFNARGLLTEMVNGREQSTTYEYDELGRVTKMVEPDNTTSYTYDANGNTLTITDRTGTIHYSYDKLDRMVEYTDVYENTISYEYDENNNVTKLTYPDGKEVAYEYNSANQLTKVTDWNERTTTYSYDANGNLVKTVRPNGTVETREYNDIGHLLALKDDTSDEEMVNHYTLQYDEGGFIISEKNKAGLEPQFLTDVISTTYTAANQIDTVEGHALSHDEDGNLLNGSLNGQSIEFAYDSRNRLVQSGDTTYTYDANNNRIAQNNGNEQTHYVVNQNSILPVVLMETDENGTPTQSYIYGLGLIGFEDSEGDYYSYHQDVRGSTTAITNMDEEVVARYAYDPFGNIIAQEGEMSQPYLYVGQFGVETDENGLIYMRARYYHPELHRFLNEDIYVGEVADSQSLNRYAYAKNNPVMQIDPDGEFAWVLAGGVIGSIYGVGSQIVSDVVTSVGTGELSISDWQTYTGQAVGGFAGGALTSLGQPVAGAGAYAVGKNAVEQGLYAVSEPEKVNLSDAVINTGIDFGFSIVGGNAASKLVKPNNPSHTHNWANSVIKKPKTAFTGKTSQVLHWKQGGIGAGISGVGDGLLRIISDSMDGNSQNQNQTTK